jgi:hypothetical protein
MNPNNGEATIANIVQSELAFHMKGWSRPIDSTTPAAAASTTYNLTGKFSIEPANLSYIGGKGTRVTIKSPALLADIIINSIYREDPPGSPTLKLLLTLYSQDSDEPMPTQSSPSWYTLQYLSKSGSWLMNKPTEGCSRYDRRQERVPSHPGQQLYSTVLLPTTATAYYDEYIKCRALLTKANYADVTAINQCSIGGLTFRSYELYASRKTTASYFLNKVEGNLPTNWTYTVGR